MVSDVEREVTIINARSGSHEIQMRIPRDAITEMRYELLPGKVSRSRLWPPYVTRVDKGRMKIVLDVDLNVGTVELIRVNPPKPPEQEQAEYYLEIAKR